MVSIALLSLNEMDSGNAPSREGLFTGYCFWGAGQAPENAPSREGLFIRYCFCLITENGCPGVSLFIRYYFYTQYVRILYWIYCVSVGELTDLFLQVAVGVLVHFKMFGNARIVEWSGGIKDRGFEVTGWSGVMF